MYGKYKHDWLKEKTRVFFNKSVNKKKEIFKGLAFFFSQQKSVKYDFKKAYVS